MHYLKLTNRCETIQINVLVWQCGALRVHCAQSLTMCELLVYVVRCVHVHCAFAESRLYSISNV